MIIEEIFKNPISRELKGVIKVGQAEEENIKQELEEYVVTRELQKHFSNFFASYKKGIVGATDKMGVWISGFFGSGKSHFLKILSYILGNKTVEGKRALDYFIDDNKIVDRMVLADMQLATDTPATVMLFNIDSKSESTGKNSKDAIVSVFLKVFNEAQGYCGAYPAVADLERKLDNEGIYDKFKDEFKNINGSDWESARYEFDFIQDDIVKALSAIGFMSEEASRNWCEKATEPYEFSVERFAELVKKYIDKKGDNHHIVFLVDEIGQYIGDDSKLMLNLQTVTEDLGTKCGGRAWIIVTSQQDIDAVTKVHGNDFSKIQGRFDTRLSLSSANVDEVIKKRILEKKKVGEDTLRLIYDSKATIIKNLILFNDGIEKKLYSGRDDFSVVYPFVPYQFNLLGSVLTAIRTFGASGKHLADGERSMLALFKESAMGLKDKEVGALVSFDKFYEPLEEFIDHSHRGVITKALDNEYINPDHESDCFTVNVLKTLFMIKYVKEIKATVEQITSLMVSHVDDDRLALQERVDKALQALIRQTLVQKNGDTYVFLTNEEQEINQSIKQQPLELSEIAASISQLVFDGIYDLTKYRHTDNSGSVSYGFNQMIDERYHKANQNHALTLKILTPNSDERSDDENILRGLSAGGVLVVLPDDRSYIDEIESALKIEKFLRVDPGYSADRYENIKSEKRVELSEHKNNAKLYLKEALKLADIYVNGDKFSTPSKDVASRINDALGKLVSDIYNKRNYINSPKSESDIRALFTNKNTQISIDANDNDNVLALDDMRRFIDGNTSRHISTSMKVLVERFAGPPYGFTETDIQWLAAKLFRVGDISLFVNREQISLNDKSVDEIIRYITRKEYREKLLIEKRAKASDNQKKLAREIMHELFDTSAAGNDDDEIMNNFRRLSQNLKIELDGFNAEYTQCKDYPGQDVVRSGIELMRDVLQMKYTEEFFSGVSQKYDEYMDFAEDYEPIKTFFKGDQRKIFDTAYKLFIIYNDSKNFIADAEIEDTADKINIIISSKNPYGEISKLPELTDKFRNLYGDLFDKEAEPIKASIQDAKKRTLDELENKKCKNRLIGRFKEKFNELEEEAESCNNMATLQSIKAKTDALFDRCMNDIEEQETKIFEREKQKAQAETSQGEQTPPPEAPKVKRTKKIGIRSISSQASWRLESPDDVKRCTARLEKDLLAALEDNTIIQIEF